MQVFRKILKWTAALLLSVWFLQSVVAHRHGLPANSSCRALLPFRITCEERLCTPAPSPDTEAGDIWITFSTHTLGWRHGHAALVIDESTLLEAAMPGVPSGYSSKESWSTYSTLAVLRAKDASAAQKTAAAETAANVLTGVPYGFFCGLGAEKAPQPPLSHVQCAYLPWYAWLAQGIDLDSDGGRLVSVADLAACSQLEVVASRGFPVGSLPGNAQ